MRIVLFDDHGSTSGKGWITMALLIGLAISFAVGALAYVNYEEEIDEARAAAEDNGFDPDGFDLSDVAKKAQFETDDGFVEDPGRDEDLDLQFFADALITTAPPVSFEPDEEQIVVTLDADVDLDAPAQNVFDPETDTTVLSFGDNAVLSLQGDKTDISVGFGTQAETENGLSPFDIVLVHDRLEPA